MSDLVKCRSEHTYAQHPVAFAWEGERLEVESVEAQWQTPGVKHFRVRTAEKGTFELAYNLEEDQWQIHQR